MFEFSHDKARKLIQILAFVLIAYVALYWFYPSLLYRSDVSDMLGLRWSLYGAFCCCLLFAIEEAGVVLGAVLLTFFVNLCEDINHMRRVNDKAPYAKEPLIHYVEPYKSTASEEKTGE